MDRHDQDQRPLGGSYVSIGLLLAAVGYGALVGHPGVVPNHSPAGQVRPTRLTITVPDLKAAVRWYADKLGFAQLAIFPKLT